MLQMKKMKLFSGILIGLLIITSCSSDDDNSNPEPPSLVGVWKQINEVEYCSTGSQQTINSSTCEQNGRFQFNSNGTYQATYFELNSSDCNMSDTENGNWEISNGSFTINNSDGSIEFTTILLTETTFSVGKEYIDLGNPCNDGHLISYEINFVRVE